MEWQTCACPGVLLSDAAVATVRAHICTVGRAAVLALVADRAVTVVGGVLVDAEGAILTRLLSLAFVDLVLAPLSCER